MPILQNKQELEEAIKTNYNRLRTELSGLPEKVTRIKELEGHAQGTSMSVCDLVAYLVGWGELVLKWHRKKEKGEPVDFPETGYQWNELGKLAQKFYGDYEKNSFPTLLDKLDRVVKDILALIAAKTNKQLYETPWYDKWTLGRLIQLNTSSPYENARLRLRRWKKRKG